ncbi:MAG: YicC family protein [Candidatus Faecalibacterium intestinavium]|uniref:YicC family protein n=1 Tax=Candidatus Faecalibacterium intestinavium TaxID=2838580 RepID=A0A9E2KI95_9FIRM|nr:YicC family protein [Candidatus Faecalibacterium intestinavium]
MILSMTGFGRASAVLNGREIAVELRSVNARYFEYSSRIPRSCSFMDGQLKKLLNSRITRGKVELSLTIQNVDRTDTAVTVDLELARSYQQALRDLAEDLCVKNDLSAGMLARFPDVLAARHADVDEDQLWEDVASVTRQALDRFMEMRAAEGQKMKEDILSRLDYIEECVGKIEAQSAGRVEQYTRRLYEKLRVLLEDRNIDDARVLTEAAIFADKTAVDEETVRLRSHLAQYRSILEMDEPVGRKLDFLTQELNRETNTIGSKCQDLDITRVVVDVKAEIEKIREQIQNLE